MKKLIYVIIISLMLIGSELIVEKIIHNNLIEVADWTVKYSQIQL